MLPFRYERAVSAGDAVARGAAGGVFLAGGTDLVPLMRGGLAAPDVVVDIARLPLAGVRVDPDGGLTIGALTRLADLERDPEVAARAPLLARAVATAASPAIRHMGTLAGNLLQRTRCPHFRAGPLVPCNRRAPGTGCSARAGDHRTAAILGVSEACIATHPSDPAVALAALDASVEILDGQGVRTIPLESLYRLPETTPHQETTLTPDAVVTAVRIPRVRDDAAVGWVKIRDRAAFDFSLVAAAALVRLTDGVVLDIRLALGGVAPRPWRCRTAEATLRGAPASPDLIREAMAAELALAQPLQQNRFKTTLAVRAVQRAVARAVPA
jgi:xanthine dehydrogenase YagS FAD-binding subunit